MLCWNEARGQPLLRHQPISQSQGVQYLKTVKVQKLAHPLGTTWSIVRNVPAVSIVDHADCDGSPSK